MLAGSPSHATGVIAATLTKLVLRLRSLGVRAAIINKTSAAAMLAIISMMRLGESPVLPTPLDDDSRDRMAACIQVLAQPEEDMVKVGVLCQVIVHLCHNIQWKLGRRM